MTYATLTTSVAVFAVTELGMRDARAYALVATDAHYQEWNALGERIQSIGDSAVEPAIWTHTPVPRTLDIKALQERFEASASCVLGDEDGPPSFAKCDDFNVDHYGDHRYVYPGIRAAWMMYVAQAIEHFNKGTL